VHIELTSSGRSKIECSTVRRSRTGAGFANAVSLLLCLKCKLSTRIDLVFDGGALLDNSGVLSIAGLEFKIIWHHSEISGWGEEKLCIQVHKESSLPQIPTYNRNCLKRFSSLKERRATN
jgi:hypothetical protein